jgi:hypothetical protein
LNDELQTDDIVKQSLDHVVLTLHRLDDEESRDDDVSDLDRHAMVELLCELSSSLVDDVRGRLEASSEVFDTSYITLRQTLDSVEAERRAFVRQMTTDGENQGWLAMFDRSNRTIARTLGEIEECAAQKRLITEYGQRIALGLSDIEESFGRFYEIIDRFYSIEVVSRIEVAKQPVLRERGTILAEMDQLTSKIEADVGDAVEEIRTSLERTSQTLSDYSATVQTEEEAVEEILRKTRASQSELIGAKEQIGDVASGFTLYSHRFLHLIEQSEQETERFREITAQMASLGERIRGMGGSASAEKDILLKAAGLEKWEVKDDDVADLVEKFTILTHKQVAGNMVGFDVEGGDQAGNLTLF